MLPLQHAAASQNVEFVALLVRLLIGDVTMELKMLLMHVVLDVTILTTTLRMPFAVVAAKLPPQVMEEAMAAG